jgi:hypothetical protein
MKPRETDSPDFRLRRSEVFSRILDRYSDTTADLQTPESRMEFFCSLGADKFIDGLGAMNRILAKNHDLDQANNFMTERSNVIADYERADLYQVMPLPEDKAPLLSYLYETCREMAAQENWSPEHIAAVLGYGINAIHPYDDCNGRTARAGYDLLLKTPDEWHDSLRDSSIDEFDVSNRLNPSYLRNLMHTLVMLDYKTHDFSGAEPVPRFEIASASLVPPWDIIPLRRSENLRDAEIIGGVMQDRHMATIAPARLVDTQDSPVVRKSVQKYMGKDLFRMDIFAREATADDIDRLRFVYREIANSYVMNLILCISDVDKPFKLVAETVEHGAIEIGIPSLATRLASGELMLAIPDTK